VANGLDESLHLNLLARSIRFHCAVETNLTVSTRTLGRHKSAQRRTRHSSRYFVVARRSLTTGKARVECL